MEDQAKLTRADKVKITEDDLTKMALIEGCRDTRLAEKALAEKPNLAQTIHRWLC